MNGRADINPEKFDKFSPPHRESPFRDNSNGRTMMHETNKFCNKINHYKHRD